MVPGPDGILRTVLVSLCADLSGQDGIAIPGKGVVLPEEVALLVEIYLKTNHGSEAVDMLTGSTMGTESSMGAQDPQLIMSLLLQCLSGAADQSTGLAIARALVKDPTCHIDDRLWDSMQQIYTAGDEKM
jgi:hypothetical protein